MVIASGTRSLREGVPAGPSVAAGGGALGGATGAGPTSSAPLISMALHPRTSRRRPQTLGLAKGIPMGKAHHPSDRPASANHQELATRLRQVLATPPPASRIHHAVQAREPAS
jgi:hypothetical protein